MTTLYKSLFFAILMNIVWMIYNGFSVINTLAIFIIIFIMFASPEDL